MSDTQDRPIRLGPWTTFYPQSGKLERHAGPAGRRIQYVKGLPLKILRVLTDPPNHPVSHETLEERAWERDPVELNTVQKGIGKVRTLFDGDPTIVVEHRAAAGYWLRVLADAPEAKAAATPGSDHALEDRIFGGREDELELLDHAWESPRTRIMVIAAVGGAGKSTLVEQWRRRLLAREDKGGVVRKFEWSFYNQGTSDRASSEEFVTAALRAFGEEADARESASPWTRGSQLAARMGASRSLLILDGLEPLQGPPDHAGEAALRDQALAALLGDIAVQDSGLCIVTSRAKIRDARRWPADAVAQHRLGPLMDAEGASVLRSYGVKGSARELERASRYVKGHALTLSLMGGYFRVAFADDPNVSRRDTFGFKSADDETQGGHAFRVMAAYEALLDKGGRRVELATLRMLGLFERPATPDCIAALKRAAIPDLTDALADVPDRTWNAALHYLETLGLIETKPWQRVRISGFPEDVARNAMAAAARNEVFTLGPPQDFDAIPAFLVSGQSIDAHPLVRAYFAHRIDGAAARLAHGCLYEHLAATVPFWPEGPEGLYVLYDAIVHGCRAGRHQEVYERVFDDRVQRGLEGPQAFYSRTRGLPEMDLVVLKELFVEPWTRLASDIDKPTQGRIISETGFRLRTLNRLREARGLLQEAIRLAEVTADHGRAAQYACTLSEVYLLLGEVPSAVTAAAMSVTHADRSAKPRLRAVRRATYGDALHQQGRIEESKRLFAEAEEVAPVVLLDGRYLDGLRSAQVCDLLLSEVERAAWRVLLWRQASENGHVAPRPAGTDVAAFRAVLAEVEVRATTTRKHAVQNKALLDEALDRLTLGRTELYGAILAPRMAGSALARARPHLEECAAGLHAAGRRDYEPAALVTLAWFRELSGDAADADARLKTALRIAEDGGMRLHQADVHLHRARLRRDLEALQQARDLVEQCGYLRRIPELRDAEQIAQDWPRS